MTSESSANNARRSLGGTLSAILGHVRSFAHIHSKLDNLERQIHGGRATYVGNNRVLVKAVVHKANLAYFVEADDLLLSPWFIITGAYEIPVTDYFLRELRPDSHCLDLGSNFGFFTCLMARFCPEGRVIAVEADGHVFPLVRDNIAINGLGNATAIHAAVSDSEGEVTLYRRSERSANTSIIQVGQDFTDILGERPPEPFTIGGVTVDALAERLDGRVDFIKVDVEGAEPLALAGARQTIARNPQLRVVMEWSPGQISNAGFDLRGFMGDLESTGLKPFDLIEGGLKPLSYDELLNLPYRAAVVLKRG